MKKMNSQYDKLNAIMENIIDIISDLEEKIGSIEDKAFDEDRDMTKKEQGKCDEIDEQISSLEDCVAYIENAMECLDDYIDYID